jgi:hypothetical protein
VHFPERGSLKTGRQKCHGHPRSSGRHDECLGLPCFMCDNVHCNTRKECNFSRTRLSLFQQHHEASKDCLILCRAGAAGDGGRRASFRTELISRHLTQMHSCGLPWEAHVWRSRSASQYRREVGSRNRMGLDSEGISVEHRLLQLDMCKLRSL